MTERLFVTEQCLNELFTDCDPYRAGAAALFDKVLEEVTQDDRDAVKRVFMRIAARRGNEDRVLRRTSTLFHEIVSAISSEDILAKPRVNAVIQEKLQGNLRTREQLRTIAADGFELCVRALAAMGATDVTIHECSERDLEPHG
jgi:hypothetical protein